MNKRTAIVLTALILSGVSIVSLNARARDGEPGEQSPQNVAKDVPKFDDSLRPPKPYTWVHYRRIAEIIGGAAGWPTDRQMTDEEWQTVICVAVALQRMHPDDVQTALVVHMVLPDVQDAPWKGIKPMLILRVMFDVPEDDPVAEDGIRPCGGFPYRPVNQNDKPSPGWPVSWVDEEPRLTADQWSGTGGGSRAPYSPREEYLYMLSHYSFRKDLDRHLDVQFEHWGHVWLMQRGKWPRKKD